MPYKDRQKALEYYRKYNKKHYQRKKEQYLERNRRYVKRNREFIAAIKTAGSCSYCPEDDPVCLDFHHKDSKDKEANIGDVNNKRWSIARIKREIAKCELVCSNCHRKLTAGRRLQRRGSSVGRALG